MPRYASNVQIPNLPVAIALSGEEQVEAVQAGSSVRLTVRQISSLYTSSTSYYQGVDPPPEPVPGTRWFDMDAGVEYTYFADEDGEQWVETSAPVVLGLAGALTPFLNVTSDEKEALSVTAGVVVFDTDLAKLCVYDGAAWRTITSV